MHPLVRRILRFDFRGKKERAEALAEILVNLEREGKIQIYETYEDGEWDFAWKIIENQEEGEVKSNQHLNGLWLEGENHEESRT